MANVNERTKARATVACVLANDFEDSEFKVPYDRLREAGHEVMVVGRKAGEQVTGKQGQEKTRVDASADQVRAQDFDLLLIPGGYSPDKLRIDPAVVAFVRAFGEQGKPVAAICHAPSLLIEADMVRDKTLTSWPSVATDVRNAGGHWVDREVVVDGNLITSRKPDDLPAFCAAMLEHLVGAPSR